MRSRSKMRAARFSRVLIGIGDRVSDLSPVGWIPGGCVLPSFAESHT
jgi:hypothetical protein